MKTPSQDNSKKSAISIPPRLSSSGKDRLLARINAWEEQKKLGTQLSESRQKEMKVRLLARIANYQPLTWSQKLGLFWSRQRVLGLVSLMTLFVFIGNFISFVPEIHAQKLAFVHPDQGQVFIKHPWEDFYNEIKEEQVIYVGDFVRTGENSEATVYFFDDSLVRLMDNSEIGIKNLRQNPFIYKTGVINLYLNQGHIWNKALQIQDEFSKFIVETNDSIISTNKGTFIVERTKDQKTEITTIDRSVNLTILNSAEKQVVGKTKLNEGFSAELKTNQKLPKQIPLADIKRADKNIKKKDWIKKNLEKDAQHEALLEQKTALAQKKPDEKPLLADLHLLPGGDDSNLKKVEESYAEAIECFQNGRLDDGQKSLAKFQAEMKNLAIETDSGYSIVYNNLLSKEKELIAIAPDSPIFTVKESLDDLKADLTTDEVEKKKVMLTSAAETLNTAHDLLEKEEEGLAEQQLKKYQVQIAKIQKLKKEDQAKILSQQELNIINDNLPLLEQITENANHQELQQLAQTSQAELEEIIVASTSPVTVQEEESIGYDREKVLASIALRKQSEQKAKLEQERAEWREQFIARKAENIISKILIYDHPDSQKNQLLREIRELDQEKRFTPYKQEILQKILNQVPIQLRHKVKEELGF